MSYQLIELKIENYARLVTNGNPLYVPLGALSPNDMTTLKVSAVVGSISALGTADLTLEESMDGGLSWTALTTATDGPVTAAGTYSVWITNDSGIPAPNVRLKVLPGAADSLYITKAYRTFTTGDNIIPRTSLTSAGLATEATQLLVLASVDDVESLLTSIDGKDFATETTLNAVGVVVAKEATLASLEAKDFATETTLAALAAEDFATETTLQTIAAKDFATETTLAALAAKDFATETTLAALAAEDFATETTLAALAAEDFATEATLAAIETAVDEVETKLDTLIAKDFATETTLSSLKTTVENRLAGSLINVAHDFIDIDESGATANVYTYKTGGAGGATVATLTVNFTDATKLVLDTVVRT